MKRQEQTTIAIFGPNSVPEHVLAHFLEAKGYVPRLIKAPPPTGVPTALLERSSAFELLVSVDVVLLWPTSNPRGVASEAYLSAMRSHLILAKTPVLTLSPALEVALQDELAVDAPLEKLFDDLVRSIEAVLNAEAG